MLERLSRYWKGAETLTRTVLALIALDEGRRDEAHSMLLELAKPGLARLERDEHFLLTSATLCDLIRAFDERGLAAELYEALLPYGHLLAFHDLLRTFAGSVSGELGELAFVLRRYDAAIAHYEAALASEHAVGARAAEISSRVGLARALRARAGTGDEARAVALLREVAAASAELGVRWRDRFGFDPETFADRKV
jgi:tetratricopeptide (TPR) repeat protein